MRQIISQLTVLSVFCCATALHAQTTNPLQPRDLDGNPQTIEAYYYAPQDLTWLADTNLGLTESFGLPRADFFSEFGNQINLEGLMLRDALTQYMNGINATVYLGFNNWRLPVATQDDPGCSIRSDDSDFVFAFGENCSGAEVGEFNQLLNNTYGSIDNSPFINLQSNNGDPEFHGHWLSSRGPAGRNYFSFGGTGALGFCGSGRCGGRYVWPVHDGDIGDAINQCVDPDGDGWGWDGFNSCMVSNSGGQQQNNCVDTPPANDGWGWNGIESCRITTAEPTCIDSPPVGDGWGWNGIESCQIAVTERACIDSPPVGDGWGWDGITSCRIEASASQSVITNFTSNMTGNSCRNIEGACIDGNGNQLEPRPISDPDNLIRNPTFDDGDVSFWNTYIYPEADASFSSTEFDDLRLSLGNSSEPWHVRAFALGLELEGGRTYRLSFDHEHGSRISQGQGTVVVESATDYTQYMSPQAFRSSITGLRYQVDFVMPVSDDDVRVTFNLGDSFGAVWLDNVVLVALD